jgi:hypothetical protein
VRLDRTVSCRDRAEYEGTGRGRRRESYRGTGRRTDVLEEAAGAVKVLGLFRGGRREADRGIREGRTEN